LGQVRAFMERFVKTSLSVRIGESSDRKDVCAVPIEELVPLARRLGFAGVCMRASVASIGTPPERVAEVRELIERHGLAVSMATGDLEIAANTSTRATHHLRDIGPYLDLAERLGTRLHRTMLRSPADIPWAQRAADQAAERGIKLAHQMHWGTLFETVDDALEVVKLVNRPRGFGVTYEPANLLLCGTDWGRDAIKRLAPHLVNVYFQNIVLDESSPTSWPSFRRGPVRYRYVPFDDPSGTDIRVVLDALREAGYDGWFTVHQPLQPGQTVEAAATEAAETLAKLL
jgi:sugar phosphate isomerase/epimerase